MNTESLKIIASFSYTLFILFVLIIFVVLVLPFFIIYAILSKKSVL